MYLIEAVTTYLNHFYVQFYAGFESQNKPQSLLLFQINATFGIKLIGIRLLCTQYFLFNIKTTLNTMTSNYISWILNRRYE